MGCKMAYKEFTDIVNRVQIAKPILFELNGWDINSNEMILNLEHSIKLTLPENYKLFVKKYGGGYFVFTIVLSCNPKSKFYLLNPNYSNLIKTHNFLPLIDLETGDIAGVRVSQNKCSNEIYLYSHDTNRITPSTFDFLEAILHYGLNK